MSVDKVGFGAVLIKMSVFDKIQQPYFVMEGELGEDYYFCAKAKKAGFDIWVDTGSVVAHAGTYFYTIKDFYAIHPELLPQDPKLIKPNGGVLVN